MAVEMARAALQKTRKAALALIEPEKSASTEQNAQPVLETFAPPVSPHRRKKSHSNDKSFDSSFNLENLLDSSAFDSKKEFSYSPNDILWLPKVAGKLKIGNPERWLLDEDEKLQGNDESNSRFGFRSSWAIADEIDRRIRNAEQIAARKDKLGALPILTGEDSDSESELFGSRPGFDLDPDDEDVATLLKHVHISSKDGEKLSRTGDRQSKRRMDAFEKEIGERTTFLANHLKEVATRVSTIDKALQNLEKMSVRMERDAETCKTKIKRMEDLLTPIYEESSRYETIRRNAEETIKAVESVLERFNALESYAVVIHAGPVKNLPKFCETMDNLKEIMTYFSKSKSPPPQLAVAENLFKTGRDGLIKEFSDLLRLHSKPIPPVMIQDAVNHGMHDPSASQEFAHYSPSVHDDLRLLSSWFLANQTKRFGFYDFMDVYATFRGKSVRESLDQFRFYYKEAIAAGDNTFGGLVGADGDTVSLSRVSLSQVSSYSTLDTLSMAGDNRSMASFAARDGLSKNVKKGSPVVTGQKDPSGKRKLFRAIRRKGARQSKRVGVPVEDDVFQNVEAFIVLVSGFLKIVESEIGLMYGIIPADNARDVFDRIVHPVIAQFEAVSKALAESILEHVSNGDFSAVILLLQILEHFETFKEAFHNALEGCHRETIKKWNGVILTFRIAVLRTMDNFLNALKDNYSRSIPPDGTVHEITSNTIAFFSNLVDFRSAFDTLITDEDRTQAGVRLTFQGQNFSQYLNSVVSHLLANVTMKAELYSDLNLKMIFLLNNITYLYKYLASSGVLEIMKETQPNLDTILEAKIHEYKASYEKCWEPVVKLLTEAIGDSHAYNRADSKDPYAMKEIKDRDRQHIKDRCSAIAKEMDALLSTQEKYSVPDQELRRELHELIRNMVFQLYSTFRERYIRIPFTKFPMKYLPLQTGALSDSIGRLFGQGTFVEITGVSETEKFGGSHL